ncbi:MAG TPA: hypothetical protein VGP96_14500 [Candidatus Dormibacteraeota bacterium]|jgi:hypothetical protein|nr:hypothetical protein [Candidatus Dormibacteraeota bacterium]
MGFVSKPVRTVEVPEPSRVPLPESVPAPRRERQRDPERRREERDTPVPA